LQLGRRYFVQDSERFSGALEKWEYYYQVAKGSAIMCQSYLATNINLEIILFSIGYLL
jgi:hypothetical protein